MPPFLNRVTEWLVKRNISIPDVVTLPQDEPNGAARRCAVEKKRLQYLWTLDPRTNMGYVEQLPSSEYRLADFIHHHYGMFNAYRFAIRGFLSFTRSCLQGDELVDPEGNPLDDPFRKYMDIYRYNFLPLPSVAYRWRRDTEFARQCLNGADPTRIVRATPENFPFHKFPCTDATVAGLLPAGTTLASLMKAKRLFLIDMTWMEGYPADEGHYTCAPIVLLWVDERKTLMPLAVQLFQSPSEGPIFTPMDPPGLWLFVKMHVQTARITMHGPCTHLYNSHLIFEVVYIAMQRHLAAHHPLLVMLKPHFWHHMAINDSARRKLIIPHGILTTLVGYEGFLFSMKNCNRYVGFDDIQIHSDLQKRGFDDDTLQTLPDYYWRDDSLRIWGVLEGYVSDVVNVVYGGGDQNNIAAVGDAPGIDAKIAGDVELQGWVRELHTPKPYGCGLAKGLPCDADGSIRTRAQLVRFVTLILFGVTAYHDGVNDAHGDIVSYPPNQSMYLVKPPPRNKDRDYTEEEMASALPGMHDVLLQLALTKSLTNLGDERFGKMLTLTNPFPPSNEALGQCFAKLMDDLGQASAAIRRRNLKVDFGYTSMDPRIMRSSIYE